jgi:hypothetical protein
MGLAKIKYEKLKILDFDIENRPLSYLGQDFTTADITAIAASWEGESKIFCWALGEVDTEEMLLGFKELYDEADIVTGHFIRNHDLPHINGALIDFGLPILGPKLTSCTKEDLVRRKGISASQENLSETFGIKEPKLVMNQPKWRRANRLTQEGIKLTKERVTSDIKQHKELRKYMIKNNLLSPAQIWEP